MGLTSLSGDAEARLRAARLTYPEVGRTAGELPAGYHHIRGTALLGYGPHVFAGAAAAVMGWELHLRAGIAVAASGSAATGGNVMLRIGIGALRLTAPCRVVYVIDQPGRRGFAYGTLAGHPESGEEAFVVSHDDDDAVTLTVTAFSRPVSRLARAAGPLGRAVQHGVTHRYLRALAGGR